MSAPRPTLAQGRLLVGLALGLLVGVPLAGAAFALGRYLPRDEAQAPPQPNAPAGTSEGDRVRQALRLLNDNKARPALSQKKAQAEEDCAAAFADTLKAQEFPDLAALLERRAKDRKGLEGQRDALQEELNKSKEQATKLQKDVTERDGQITKLQQDVTQRDGQIAKLQQQVNAKGPDHEKGSENAQARLALARRLLVVQKGFLELAAQESPAPSEQLRATLREKFKTLNTLAGDLQKPSADLKNMEKALDGLEKDVKDLKAAAMTGGTDGADGEPRDLKEAREMVEKYARLKKSGDLKNAAKAKSDAEALLNTVEFREKGKYDKEIKELRNQLK
jgi:hypothetical protein